MKILFLIDLQSSGRTWLAPTPDDQIIGELVRRGLSEATSEAFGRGIL